MFIPLPAWTLSLSPHIGLPDNTHVEQENNDLMYENANAEILDNSCGITLFSDAIGETRYC